MEPRLRICRGNRLGTGSGSSMVEVSRCLIHGVSCDSRVRATCRAEKERRGAGGGRCVCAGEGGKAVGACVWGAVEEIHRAVGLIPYVIFSCCC